MIESMPMKLAGFEDVRCPFCSSEGIEGGAGGDADSKSIEHDRYRCADCGTTFDKVWGVPFFGHFEQSEILGLIEISANVVNRGRFGITPSSVEALEETCARYHASIDKPAFVAANAAAQPEYFANRYNEWLELNDLLAGVDLVGRRVLDLGAGLGFDSHRLSLRGADVTALEFSPLLAESGHVNFPHIRWIGGFSHALPFASQSFDAVFCNAALHHMRDIRSAIAEGLRVLRPGGVLITTCDSFCPSAARMDLELGIFDGNPAVHMGVNERVPRFSEFISTLVDNRDLIDIEIFTHMLYGAPHGDGGRRDLAEFTKWDFDRDREMISERSGSIAMKIRLKAPWPHPSRRQSAPAVHVGEYAEWLGDQTTAMARLAALLPAEFVGRPFPRGADDKFEMLNGWRRQLTSAKHRRAYRRARWYLRRKNSESMLRFEVRAAKQPQVEGAKLSVLVNGNSLATVDLASGKWTPMTVTLSDVVQPDASFAVEFFYHVKDDAMDAASFDVRGLELYSAPALLVAQIKDYWKGLRNQRD